MRLQYYFLLLALFVVGLLSWMIYQVLRAPELLSISLGVGMVLSLGVLVLLWVVYERSVRAMESISNGIHLLNEQDFSSRLRPTGQYEADRIIGIFNRMMTQLKEERLHVREQNEFSDLLIKASPMGVVVLDYDHRITLLNPSACYLLAVKDQSRVLGRKVREVRHELLVDLSVVALGERKIISLGDGHIYRCSLSTFVDRGFPRPFYLIESLTDEVRSAEKKAYEKVIRMIAHEVGNSTAGLTSTLGVLIDSFSGEAQMADAVEAMQVCVDRCYGMNRFITSFAEVVRIPEPVLALSDIGELVQRVARFSHSLSQAHEVSIKLDLDEAMPQLSVDVALMEQVLINVVKNAVESIAHGPGRVVLRTSTSPLSLSVIDDGAGISPEQEGKLFSPFFSTKPAGQGLGLLFVREVLQRHGFRYSLSTHADGLTHFVIYF